MSTNYKSILKRVKVLNCDYLIAYSVSQKVFVGSLKGGCDGTALSAFLPQHTRSLVWSPHENRLFSNHLARIYTLTVDSGVVDCLFDGTEGNDLIRHLQCSDDGTQIAFTVGNSLYLLSANNMSGERVAEEVLSASLSRSFHRAVLIDSKGCLSALDTRSGRSLWSLELFERPWRTESGPRDELALVQYADEFGIVHLGLRKELFRMTGKLATFSPDGSQIAYIGDSELLLLDRETGVSRPLIQVRNPETAPSDPAPPVLPSWSPDGRLVSVSFSHWARRIGDNDLSKFEGYLDDFEPEYRESQRRRLLHECEISQVIVDLEVGEYMVNPTVWSNLVIGSKVS